LQKSNRQILTSCTSTHHHLALCQVSSKYVDKCRRSCVHKSVTGRQTDGQKDKTIYLPMVYMGRHNNTYTMSYSNHNYPPPLFKCHLGYTTPPPTSLPIIYHHIVCTYIHTYISHVKVIIIFTGTLDNKYYTGQ
jgi:hypothetical protein